MADFGSGLLNILISFSSALQIKAFRVILEVYHQGMDVEFVLHLLPARISYFELGKVAVPKTKPARPTRSILAKLNSPRVGLPSYLSFRMLLDLNIDWVSFV